MAESFGAEVTGVDLTGNLDALRSIRANPVLDDTREDFTPTGRRYALILDVSAFRSMFDIKPA